MFRFLVTTASGLAMLTVAGAAQAQEQAESFTMDEIIVTGRSENSPSKIAPDAAALLKTPGELSDPVKAISLLPGVTFAASDFDELVIRGTGPDDNLLLIDNIPFFRILHDLSDTIVSDWAVRTFEVYSGTAPASYGTGLGGVVNIRLRQPVSDRVGGVLDLSQIRSGIFLEGPVSDNLSGYISIRENLARVFLKSFETETDVVRERLPESRDYNAKLHWQNDGTSLTLTSIGAYDKSEDEQLDSVDAPAGTFDFFDQRQTFANAAEIDRSFENGSNFTFTGAYIQTKSKSSGTTEGTQTFDVNTTSLRSQYTVPVGSTEISAGLNFRSDEATSRYDSENPESSNIRSFDGFASFERPLSDTVFIEAGASISYDDVFEEVIIDPRLGVEYSLNSSSTFFAKAGSVSQAPDLEKLFYATADAREALDKNRAREASIGYRFTPGGNWRAQTEIFYKDLDVVDFNNNIDPVNVDGEVYGLDLLISRSTEKGLYGFLALSLSENTRTSPLTGQTYDYEFGFPVSMTLSLNYATGSKWRFGAKYRYQSGQVFTPAASFDGQRSDAYQRLDMRVERQAILYGTETTLYVDAINVLGAENRSDQDPDYDGRSGIPFIVAFGARIGF